MRAEDWGARVRGWGCGERSGALGEPGFGVRGRGSGDAPPAAGSPRPGGRSGFFTFEVRRGLYAGLSSPPPPFFTRSPPLPPGAGDARQITRFTTKRLRGGRVLCRPWGASSPTFPSGSVASPARLRRLSSRRAELGFPPRMKRGNSQVISQRQVSRTRRWGRRGAPPAPGLNWEGLRLAPSETLPHVALRSIWLSDIDYLVEVNGSLRTSEV